MPVPELFTYHFKLQDVPVNYKKFLPKNFAEKLEAARWHVTRFVEEAAGRMPSGARVLDAGAGECWYKSFFDGKDYYACDFGKGKTSWDYGSLDFCCDLSRMAVKDSSFDAVLATQVLEHLSEPLDFLKESLRVLKRGGRIYITAPQTGNIHQEPYDFYRYTRYGLEHLLKKAGFEVEEIRPHGGYFLCAGHVLVRCHRNLFSRRRGLLLKMLTAIIEPFSKLFFTVAVPALSLALDCMDTEQSDTLGYSCVARKP
jgi:SAM-dependent methyltransferase